MNNGTCAPLETLDQELDALRQIRRQKVLLVQKLLSQAEDKLITDYASAEQHVRLALDIYRQDLPDIKS